MKVLLEMDEELFREAWIGNKLPGVVLGTEKDMTMEIMYQKADLRDMVNDFPFSDEAFDRIENEIGMDRFVEAVIDRINHLDPNLGISETEINLAIQEAYDYDFQSSADEARAAEDGISLDGLRTALQRYGENGQKGICGPWNVHDGGYDLQFEICYNGNSIVGCYGRSMFSDKGSLERHVKISDKIFSEICDLVHSAFPECSMAEEEQAKIRQNKQEQR